MGEFPLIVLFIAVFMPLLVKNIQIWLKEQQDINVLEEEKVYLILEAYGRSYLCGFLSLIVLMSILGFESKLGFAVCLRYWGVCTAIIFLFFYAIRTLMEAHQIKTRCELRRSIHDTYKKGE